VTRTAQRQSSNCWYQNGLHGGCLNIPVAVCSGCYHCPPPPLEVDKAVLEQVFHWSFFYSLIRLSTFIVASIVCTPLSNNYMYYTFSLRPSVPHTILSSIVIISGFPRSCEVNTGKISQVRQLPLNFSTHGGNNYLSRLL
jgi:hypothetical protein